MKRVIGAASAVLLWLVVVTMLGAMARLTWFFLALGWSVLP